ncbi:hypothetical protein [Sphingomonas sp.]|uniref:hypothetical protein n=1 Tax=Sphingomonas sp. TaxID=28214 RepID=UPI00307E1378
MWIAALAFLAAAQAGGQDAPALTPGTVTVETAAGADTPAAVRQVFADAVEQALLDARFTALPSQARGRYIARIGVTRAPRGAVASNGREPGASGGVGNWGGGISVALPSDKRQLRGLIVTTLTVELVARADDTVVWRGSALTAQAEGTRADTPAALAAKLAPAIIRSFPQPLAEPLSIP